MTCLRQYYLKPIVLSLFIVSVIILSSCGKKITSESMILNLPYHEARSIILERGWQPVPQEMTMPFEDRGIRINNFHKQGFFEVAVCSGTGMGYCQFYFTNKHGVFLKVITRETPVKGFDPDMNNRNGAVVIGYYIDEVME